MLHRIFGVLALAAFAMEEVAHQRGIRRGILPEDPTADETAKQKLDHFDVLRLLELLFLVLLMSTAAGNPGGPHGQATIVLSGLQTARLFGRRVLSRWSVLGVLQALEILILALVILLPLHPDTIAKPPLTAASLMALSGTLAYGILISICTAFSISYWVKFFSRENSRAYDSFPPLADSGNWSVKFSRKAFYPGILGTSGLVLVSGVSLLSILFSVSVILQATGLFLAGRSSYSGHNPVSHIFWDASFLLVFAMVLSGITNISGT